jgi:hypothetical protein
MRNSVREARSLRQIVDNFDTPEQKLLSAPPRRSARFIEEPGYYPEGGIWLYGNAKLLHSKLHCIQAALGPNWHDPIELSQIESEAEEAVLGMKVLVCGIHHAAHMRSAIIPLRFGAPRIVVVSGGFHYHLGRNLTNEPFPAARLWRYQWDPDTDLIISRRAPEKLPTYATHNPTVDRLIDGIANHTWPGLNSPLDSLTPCLAVPSSG